MKRSKLFRLVITLTIAISINSHAQTMREKAFIKTLQELCAQKEMTDYKDRISLAKSFKNKLVISDLKDHPVLNSIYEEDDLIIAPNTDIVKSDPHFYVLPKKFIATKDSCLVEFEVINKYKKVIEGHIWLIPNKPSETYDSNNFKTRSTITVTNP